MSGNAPTYDTQDVAAIFRKRLIQLRQEQTCVSREVSSGLCGLSSDMIRRYENGERIPGFFTLSKLADYFGVSVDYLLGRSDSR